MTARPLALIADDDEAVIRLLAPALRGSGYEFAVAKTPDEAGKCIASAAPDIVLLGLTRSDENDLQVVDWAREWSDVPIIVLSACQRESSKIEALDRGADDYLNKPFHLGELLARMRVAARHRMQRKAETPLMRIGGLEVDIVRQRVRRDGAELNLTPKELELLALLARHRGKVLTHRQILTAVWGGACAGEKQYLRVYIQQLRRKIEDDPARPRLILTRPGVGYAIEERQAAAPVRFVPLAGARAIGMFALDTRSAAPSRPRSGRVRPTVSA